MAPDESRSLNPLEKLLNLFTEVRPGEGTTALLMAFNIFFILVCYYILKPAREAFLSQEPNGAELAAYASAAMAVLLLPIVRVYGRLAERFVRRKLITYVNSFFILNMVVFYLMAEGGVPFLGLIFFVWVGIFNNMVIAQFWAYGNDIYLPDQGKRLFPFILLGQTVGAILGTRVAEQTLVLTGNAASMCVVAAACLGIAVFLTNFVDKRESKAAPRETTGQEPTEEPMGKEGGFKLILQNRYLLLIALLILVLNLVNTTGEFILRDTVYKAAQEPGAGGEFAGLFYANFFFWVNVLTVILQSFLVSRLLKYIGVRGALFVLPFIALGGYSLIAVAPVLLLITIVKTAENSVDYSLMNTLRAALWLPTTREMKYKAKQAVDTFFVRAGDVISAGVVFVLGSSGLAFGPRGFAAVVVFFVVIWLILARGIAREHKKLLPDETGESPTS